MPDRLDMRGARRGALPGRRPEGDRLERGAALGQMMRQQLGLPLLQLRKAFAQHGRDPPMQRLALAFQDRFIGGVANERMLEHVFAVWRQAMTFDKARLRQFQQSRIQLGRRHIHDLGQKVVTEAPADGRADVGDPPRRAETIEPRHQRIVQGGRNDDPRGASARQGHGQAFEDRFRHLLDEQRNPVAAGDDLSECVRRQDGGRVEMGADSLGVAAIEARQFDVQEIDAVGPAVRELGPGGRHDHPGAILGVRHDAVQQLERRRIAPVQILERQQGRLAARPCLQDGEQRVERDRLELVRRQGLARRRRRRRKPEQIGDHGNAARPADPVARHQPFELGAPRVGGFASLEAGRPRNLLGDR